MHELIATLAGLYLFTALNFNENRVWKKGWTKSSLAATVR